MDTFNNDILINPDGSLNEPCIRYSAEQRAYSQYGVDVTEADILWWVTKCRAIAEVLSERKRGEVA